MIIAAIDVGYGNTKYVSNPAKLECGLFPSVALEYKRTALSGLGKSTRPVLVDGKEYLTGSEAEERSPTIDLDRYSQVDYCLSPEYKALVYSALDKIGFDSIDLMVLGLPLNTWEAYKARLAERFSGQHEITTGRRIFIKQCVVVPQPVGALYDCGVLHNRLKDFSRMGTLIVDPGYNTLDYLFCRNQSPVPERSGARASAGMGHVLRGVLDDIAETESGGEYSATDLLSIINIVDDCLRLDQPIPLAGGFLEKPTQFYLERARERAAPLLKTMQDTVGRTLDVANIILVGGGSHIFKPLVETAFNRPVLTVPNPQFSNVRGFQHLGYARMNVLSARKVA